MPPPAPPAHSGDERPPSRFSDLDRPPLSPRALQRALVVPGGLWQDVRVVAETGSTNADVAALAAAGAPEGTVVVAEAQTAGRGRLGREWVAPPRSGLTLSVLLRPGAGVPVAGWGWLPLLGGLAVATAVEQVAGLPARVKWPNDVLVGERKLAGILAERPAGASDAVVLGIGLNVSLRTEELPVPSATSVRLAGAESWDREPLLRAVLRELDSGYSRWRRAGGNPDAGARPLRAACREASATLGRDVVAHLPGGRDVSGRAVDIDADGALVLLRADGAVTISAGDVVHVR